MPSQPPRAEGGEGVEPLWRNVDVKPDWKAINEWLDEEEKEEEEVTSAIDKVIRYLEKMQAVETNTKRYIRRAKVINRLYELKWEILGVRMKE
jgi:hypothetical protein